MNDKNITDLFFSYPHIYPEDDKKTKMLKLGQQLLMDAQVITYKLNPIIWKRKNQRGGLD